MTEYCRAMFSKCSLFLMTRENGVSMLGRIPFVFNRMRKQAFVAQWIEQRFPKPMLLFCSVINRRLGKSYCLGIRFRDMWRHWAARGQCSLFGSLACGMEQTSTKGSVIIIDSFPLGRRPVVEYLHGGVVTAC